MEAFSKILLLCLSFGYSELYGQNGCIYGKVVDNNTGECLSNVSVSLVNDGNTMGQSTTKVDGTYTFDITQTSTYQLFFKRVEYDDFSYASFPVCLGESIRKDAPLQKPPRFIRITEINDHNKEIEVLDVGILASENVYYVDFFNSGGVDIDYVIGKMCEWITAVTPSSGTLKPNESNRITIKINPDKFEAGKTTGKMLVITNNGNKILDIKAIGEFPVITTLPPYPISLPQKFQCQISFNGRHTFKEMGYCFSDINPTPTINDNVVLALVYKLDTFEYDDNLTYAVTDKHEFPWLRSTELFDLRFACRTYYVRAFLKYENENNTVIYSDNIEKFTLMEFLCP
jgi:hypothetical protein